jgi:hypothetical protein
MAEYKGPLDYIDVAARIVEFRTKHPEGNLEQRDLRFIDFAGKSWVVYTAAAMRHPEDQHPGIGTAWEPVPGPTQFTRDSELQNAETAAWGRAMVAALAVDTKKGIASQEEVRNRQTDKPTVAKPATVQRSAPVSDKPLTPTQQQIKDSLEMLAPDERAEFGVWWLASYPKGVQNLNEEQATAVWNHLFAVLNDNAEPEPPQGNLEPSEVIAEAFGEVEPVPQAKPSRLANDTPNPNGPSQKQMDFIRKMCDDRGVDVYEKASNVLESGVTSLKALSKAQAKKLIDTLIAEKDA